MRADEWQSRETARWEAQMSKQPDPRTAALAEALHAAGIRCSPHMLRCRASHMGHATRLLAALDAAGWTLTAVGKPEQILVFDADHHRVVGFVTFGVGDGFIHSHDGFGFHSHEEKP